MSKDNQKRIVSRFSDMEKSGRRIEWICDHGIGHHNGVHGCDGCCADEPLMSKTSTDEIEPKEEVEGKCNLCTPCVPNFCECECHEEEVGEPIGTDCQCDLGSEKHYHPDCEYLTPPLEVKEEDKGIEICTQCDQPYPNQEVKEGSKDIEPTFTFSGRCEEGVEGCTRLGYHSHTSKDIECKENCCCYSYRTGITPCQCGCHRNLLSQQEAKIKRELIEKIEKNEGCLYSGDVNYIKKLLNE